MSGSIILKLVGLPIIWLAGLLSANAATIIVTVGDNGNFFSPSNFSLNPGDTVKWVWVSGHHNTSGVSLPAGAVSWYGNVTSMDTTFSYIPSISGLYTYTCTHHSGMDGQFFVTGCNFPVKPLVSSAGSAACAGDTLLLATNTQAGSTYQWIRDGVTIPGAPASTCYAAMPGVYKVLVNRCGMDSVSAPYPVAMHALPVVSFNPAANGNVYTFTNTSPVTAGLDFLWTFSDAAPPQVTINASHTFLSPGSHWVCLKATNTNTGCNDSLTIPLEVSLGIRHTTAAPVFAIFPNPAGDGTMIMIRGVQGTASLHIYAPSGQCVLSRQAVTDGTRVSLSGFKPGLYNYRIFNRDQQPVTGKLSVN